MIWLMNFPLPPSANDHLAIGRGKGGAKLYKTDVHRKYVDLCHLWARQNRGAFDQIQGDLMRAKLISEKNCQPFALRVDAYVVFHVERVFTPNKMCWNLDANNRLKPLLDGLVAVLGIDDKHFFGGNCEKVTTHQEDRECAILRISYMKPRTLEEITALMRRETSIPASSSSASAKA